MNYICLLVAITGALCWQQLSIPEAHANPLQGSANCNYLKRLSAEQISAINVLLTDDVQLGVDSMIRFEVEVTYLRKGKERVKSTVTRVFKYIQDWSELNVEIHGGKRKGNNMVVVNRNLEDCTNGTLTITVRHKSNPDVTGTGSLHLLSGKPVLFNRSGSGGKNGRNALFAGKNARAGDNGNCERDASSGNDGIDGDAGESGHNINVFVRKKYNPHVGRDVLYFAIIDEARKDTSFMIADTAADIKLMVTGGNGGTGGDGSRGGDGYADGQNICCDPARGGDGGHGGRGGDGGKIVVHLDTSINADSIGLQYEFGLGYGGSGGSGGAGGSRGRCSNDGGKTAEPGSNGSRGSNGVSGSVQVIHEPVSDELLKFFSE